MGRLILIDAIEMWEALKEYVEATIPFIFEQEEEIALKLDEHYSDLIRLAKKMESLYQMKFNFNDSDGFTAPSFHQFDKEFNKKEELFIYDVRKRRKEREAQNNSRNGSIRSGSDSSHVNTRLNSSQDSYIPKKRESIKKHYKIGGYAPEDGVSNDFSNAKSRRVGSISLLRSEDIDLNANNNKIKPRALLSPIQKYQIA